MLFEPACPQEVEVEREDACVDRCTVNETVWAPVDDGHDACAPTQIAYTDCVAMLSCEERTQHFELLDEVVVEDRLSCGMQLRAQLDCQTAHY